MADFWFAECIPYKWEEKHTDQGAAIRAAEDHVIDKHRDVPPHVRGAQFMGHVQNRTENAISTALETSPATPPAGDHQNFVGWNQAPAPASTVTASEDSPNPNPSGE